jgi:hypothetical protein
LTWLRVCLRQDPQAITFLWQWRLAFGKLAMLDGDPALEGVRTLFVKKQKGSAGSPWESPPRAPTDPDVPN